MRVQEHLHKKSQPTSVYKHLEASNTCRQSCDESCFTILDVAPTKYKLEVKEAILNEWKKPSINKQRQLLNLSIMI